VCCDARLLTFVCGSLPTQLKQDVVVNGRRRPPVPLSGELDKTSHYIVFPKRCVCQLLFSVGTSKSSPHFEYNLVSVSLSSAMCVFWISSLLMMSKNTPYGKRHGKRHGISYTHLSSWKASRKVTRNGLYTLSVLEKLLRK